ncbi:A-kinase anchor protein 13-like isoform X3 [Amphiprion ocellaris]|uniref:A-kinase anchor protein 13-like isoform X3 n=1 Tax=Amphiprion ocellaris TaxID=80972 RepID=UPI0024115D18|nr:A-kinase anchor protein 13-like isoform X3 [Amphiprion ocellaris]
MRLNPQHAPLYGECVLTVQLDHEDMNNAEEEEEVEFYLIFSGSTQRHVSSTLPVNHFTLQAVCPAHNMCEQVLVTLCLARPDGPVDTQSQETFNFVQDLALDMAHFLIGSTAPQEASLLDDEQIPLKECERLDESLALALKHISLPHHRSAPGALSQTDIDRQMDNQTQTVTVMDTCTQVNSHRNDAEIHQETWMDISPLQDSCPVVSQCQQLSSLMHLAASHGLKTVALFLLQQPGGKEALKRTNTQGQTPACLAKTRGHQLLVELFTQYETFSDVQVEAEEKLHFYPGGRVFQHHENLGTYTLTFSSLLQRERTAEEDSSGGCVLQKMVKELRRLIRLHRVPKDKSDFAPTHVPINKEVICSACGLQSCCNGQQDIGNTDNCSAKPQEQGSAPSLEERTQGEDSTVVTHTSGCLCQSQEAAREQKGTPAANSHPGQKKKNKKKTTKATRSATEPQGNNTRAPEASRRTAQKSTKTTRSATVSPREQAVAFLIGDSGATKNQCSPGTQETLLAVKPVLVPSGDGKCAGRKAVALPTTTVTEKQEGEKWEVELLMCERMIETGTEIQTEQRGTQSLKAEEALESAAERTVFMGQEQSHDPQQDQSDTDKPSQPHPINKGPQSGTRTSPRSPDVEGTHRRVLWRDGGWIGSRMGSFPEPVGKTVWYQGENLDQGANEDSIRKEANSQSVWYDTDIVDEQKHGQLEGMREQRECDLSSPQASGVTSHQQLEQGLNFHQLSAALSHQHAAGTQPALSHGLDGQRQEAHRSQREEEVRSDWKEERVEGCREDVCNRETTNSRKSSETAHITEGGDEKPEREEGGAKGKKKRRKKRGKKGNAEAKLTSSSSVESQSQIEIQTHREQVTNLNAQVGTESVFKADIQPVIASGPTQREEAEKDAMHLPRRTEVQTRPDSDITNSVCSFTTKLLSHTDDMETDLTETPASQTVETKELSEDKNVNFHGPDYYNPDSTTIVSEVIETDIRKVDTEKVSTVPPMAMELLDPTEQESKGPASVVQQTVDNAESKALSENEDLAVAGKATASVNQRGLVQSYCPKELPVMHPDPTELTVDLFLLEFPEQKTLQSVDLRGRPVGFLESVHLPFEYRADASPLQIREGNADTTARKYLEHCLASEMLRDQPHNEEKRNELWVGEEEAGKARSGERKSEENDSRMVHDKELCYTERRKQVKHKEFLSLDSEKEQKCEEDLVATAVAVVTVAIASAVTKIELSQNLVNSQSESQEAANGSPLEKDRNIASSAIKQMASDVLNTVDTTQMTAKFLNKDSCPLIAVSPAETEHSHVELLNQSSSKEEANIQISEKSDFVELLCTTETEKLPAALLNSKDQPKLDLSPLGDAPSLPQWDEETIRTETTLNNLFACSLPKEGSLLHVCTEPLTEETKMTAAEVDSNAYTQTDILLHKESQHHCPVIDTGQDPVNAVCEESLTLMELRDSKDQTVCPKEGDGQQLDSHDTYGGCLVEWCETEGQTNSACIAEESGTSDTHCHAKEHESHLQLMRTPCEGDITPLPFCSSILSVTSSDLAYMVNPIPEEPSTLVNVETGQIMSSANTKLVNVKTCSASNQGKDPECVAVDDKDNVFKGVDKDSDTQDTVDGWKERKRNRMKREMESKQSKMVTAEDTFQTEAEPFPAAEVAERDLESTHTLQIKRENDVLYPVQSSLECSSVTPCTDIHPDRGECVSVCLLHRETVVKDSLEVNADLDDSVFKKPKEPLSFVRHMDKQVHIPWSSTDDALMQEAFSPSKGVSSSISETAASQNSRLSWKSETEDRGGGEAEEMGHVEENKDQLSGNPVSSAILRASIRSLSPLRRHSWEPANINTATHIDIVQHSPLKSLSEEMKRAKPLLHRRSMSWCPSNLHCPNQEQIDNRSCSLEGLEVGRRAVQAQCPSFSDEEERAAGTSLYHDSQDKGSLVSLTEEELEGDDSSIDSQPLHQVLSVTTSCPAMIHHQTLTKSISISHRDIDVGGFPRSKRQISFSVSISSLLPKSRHHFSIGSSSSDDDDEEGGRVSSLSVNSGSLGYSISEEPGPLRNDTEGKGGPKISRTFSYLRSKMSKKGKEKEKERRGESKRECKEREKKSASGHLFIPINPPAATVCQHCTKRLHNKETSFCNNCGVHVHKSCTESLSVCAKSKTKQQLLVPASVPGSAVNMRSKSTSSASSLSSTSSSSSRERWSSATTPDDQLPVMFPRRHPSIFNPHSNLAKSISTSNIAGFDEVPLKGLKFLSQSTDSLHQGSKVNDSTESLMDEGTEMIDSQLMGEFECDIKDLEADSWSGTVDKKFLKTLKKDEIKRQDIIYELYQTEVHHVRTLKIMSEVYYKGLQKELQLDTQTVDKIFPVLDELVEIHTHFLTLLLERKRASSTEAQNGNRFLIYDIGDILLNQFSGCKSDRMKKVYGKFCSRHNEAVNLYKDLHAKDKRFQAFIKRIMSSSIVRRLSIPECILLVTQRITKYPVLIQRILQHTKDSDEDHSCVSEALCCVKELIMTVDNKVNEHEKKRRLREVYSRTDSKSIMRMKSGQMFAKEDLIRGRKLLHDGVLQLKNSAGRLKEVNALLLSDVLVFLQEKDQKYAFASLDQRSTVISLQNLIVREVANEERGLFLITAGTERPEMVEVLASSKEERNTWKAIIQEAMHSMEKNEDEGLPSETEEDRRQQENRAKEIRELLRRKDEQIISLLEEKVHIFRELGDCNPAPEDTNSTVRERMLFMVTPDVVTKGEPIINNALREVETLHALVSCGVGGADCSFPVGVTGGSVGPVCLPRRAETFGGFDSHQMNSSKNGEKEEGDESADLRRTESDSLLKKGTTASLQMLLKRSNAVLHSVTHLHDLLISLQAVVVKQDSFIEDQRQALNDRFATNSSRHSSSSSLSSSSSSRPSSLIEQEKHRSLERQRQEVASLQKQQVAHQEEKRKREKTWELKEKGLAEREERLRVEEDETRRRHKELMVETETLQRKKEDYQRELERLREAQRKLEREQEALRRDTERLYARDQSEQLQRYQPTSSTTLEDSLRFHSSGSLDLDSREVAEPPKEVELSSSAPTKEHFLRIGSKRMGKNFNPFSSAPTCKPQGAEKESQLPTKLLQLAKPKEKKDKKKKKGKGGDQAEIETKVAVMLDPQNEGDIFYC